MALTVPMSMSMSLVVFLCLVLVLVLTSEGGRGGAEVGGVEAASQSVHQTRRGHHGGGSSGTSDPLSQIHLIVLDLAVFLIINSVSPSVLSETRRGKGGRGTSKGRAFPEAVTVLTASP